MSKLYKVIFIIIAALFLFSKTIYAVEKLNLEIKTSKEEIKVGDKFTVTVDWKEGMQAADFSLLYDNEKLEYINSDLDELFVNNEGDKITVAWFSDNNTDKTKIEFKFKAIKEGQAELKTKILGGFATGELKQPYGYNEGNETLEIIEGKAITIPIVVLIILFIIFLIFIINKKIKGGKRK